MITTLQFTPFKLKTKCFFLIKIHSYLMWSWPIWRVRNTDWMALLLTHFSWNYMTSRVQDFNVNFLASHVSGINSKTCCLSGINIGTNSWTINMQFCQIHGLCNFNLKIKKKIKNIQVKQTENGVSSMATLSSAAQITYFPGLWGTKEIFCWYKPSGDWREVENFLTLSTNINSGS